MPGTYTAPRRARVRRTNRSELDERSMFTRAPLHHVVVRDQPAVGEMDEHVLWRAADRRLHIYERRNGSIVSCDTSLTDLLFTHVRQITNHLIPEITQSRRVPVSGN